MRLLTATLLVSMAVIGQAMPVIHIATGPHWTTAQPAPAPPPQVGAEVEDFREADPATASAGTAASTRPVTRPVTFSIDDIPAQDNSSANATDAQPPAGLTPFAAAAPGVGAAAQTASLGPSAAVVPQVSALNADPTGWSAAMADQQAPSTPGVANVPGLTSFPGAVASPFAAPGMVTGMPGAVGTGTFTPATVASPSSNPDSDRATAFAQATANGGTPAASTTFGGVTTNPFGTTVPGAFGAPAATGGTGVVDPFTQQGGILGAQAGTPGSTVPGVTPGFTGTTPGFPGTTAGTNPFAPTTGVPGSAPPTGDTGLGVQTRRNAPIAQ